MTKDFNITQEELNAFTFESAQNKSATVSTPAAAQHNHLDNNTVAQVFQQKLENLPDELLNQPRFFEVNVDKTPKVKGWSKLSNQKKYTEVKGIAGFDICGHDKFDDYLLLDFDNVLNPNTGEFTNQKAKDWYEYTRNFLKSYCETSVTKTGIHIIIKPTPGVFGKITSSKAQTLYFDELSTDESNRSKLETYYLHKARYCLLTGEVYDCSPKTPITGGDKVDTYIDGLLSILKSKNPNPFADNDTPRDNHVEYHNNIEPPATERALAMLQYIPCDLQPYSDWISIGMILKSNGNSLSNWENWSRTDIKRFKDGECYSKWQSFKGDELTIATLHKIAASYGYSEYAFKKNWYNNLDKKDSPCYNGFTNKTNNTVGEVFSRPILADSSGGVNDEGAGKMKFFTTKEAADFLGVSTSTLKNWRRRKLFGVPFFDPAINEKSECPQLETKASNQHSQLHSLKPKPQINISGRPTKIYYSLEQLEQLKSVYVPGNLSNIYRALRKVKMPVRDLKPNDDSLLSDTPKTVLNMDALFNIDETAKILGVNERTLRRWDKQRIFEPFLSTHDGEFLYTLEEINQRRAELSDKQDTDDDINNTDKDHNTLTDEQRKTLFELPTTDVDNAEKILCIFGDYIRYIDDLDRWAVFESPVWNIAKTPKNSTVYPFAGKLRVLMVDNFTSPEHLKKAAPFMSRKKTADAVEMIKGFPQIIIKSKRFNQNPMLLNCPNGIIDLQTGDLLPHDSNLLFTQCTGAEYNPTFRSPVVDNFLAEILPDNEVRKSLLIFLGYCLTGNVQHDKALFIHGSGRNGKGGLMEALMRCLGDFATPLKNSVVLQNNRIDDGETATPELAKLEFKRLAIMDEIPAGRQLNESKFKSLTGGDKIPIRRLHQESSTIDNPTHKLILSGNFLPEIRDARDIAISERLLVIKFEQSFVGDKCKPEVRENLKKPESLTGLLTVLVEHCIEWQKTGKLYEPPAVTAFKKEYLVENDLVGEFIDTFCSRSTGSYIICKDFVDRFKRNNPASNMSDKAIIAAAEKIEGIKKHKYNFGRAFKGIKWCNPDEGDMFDGTDVEVPY